MGILADAQSLKNNASMFYHPEASINVDGAVMGRNYFTRPSAEEQESKEEADERARILADAQSLKNNASMFYHPEASINVDGAVMGRNYFTRPSALIDNAKIVSSEVSKVESKVYDAPKTVVIPTSKSITKQVFDGKVGPQNNDTDIPRSASAVILFNPDADM